jgi:hypothetical protein
LGIGTPPLARSEWDQIRATSPEATFLFYSTLLITHIQMRIKSALKAEKREPVSIMIFRFKEENPLVIPVFTDFLKSNSL